MVAGSRLQTIDEELVILIVDECGLLIESAQDDVLRLVGDIETCEPCHAGVSNSRVGIYPKVRKSRIARTIRRGAAKPETTRRLGRKL